MLNEIIGKKPAILSVNINQITSTPPGNHVRLLIRKVADVRRGRNEPRAE